MGSVHPYTTAGGKKFYRIHYRRPDHRQTSERGFKTKRDAELRLAEVEISKARGDYVDPSTAIVTVGTLGAQWLDQRRGVLKPSSFRPCPISAAGARTIASRTRTNLCDNGSGSCNDSRVCGTRRASAPCSVRSATSFGQAAMRCRHPTIAQ